VADPPGGVILLPGRTPHFHEANRDAYITRITAIGPLDREYLNPKNDPREQGRR
jgi:hypothetical protein